MKEREPWAPSRRPRSCSAGDRTGIYREFAAGHEAPPRLKHPMPM